MRFLSKVDAAHWWNPHFPQNGPDLREHPPLPLPSFESTPIRALYPTCRAVLHWLTDSQASESLVWILEHGIWTENRHIYDTWRSDRGASTSPEVAPAHLFAADESSSAIDLLFLVLPSGWGLTAAAAHRAININHDGQIRVHAESEDAASNAARLFTD